MLPADEIRDATSPLHAEVRALVRRWLAMKAMPPMGFLVDVQSMDLHPDERHLLAEQNGHVIGALIAVPICAREGWLIENVLRDPSAPNGTSELLIDAAMRGLAAEGSHHVTLGLVPLAGPVDEWLRRIRNISTPLYDFGGIHAFKAKLRPDRWDPIFIAYLPSSSAVTALYDSLAAFARGSFVGFGVRTILRGPTPVIYALAALLLPWTTLLAVLPAKSWFPTRGVQTGWVLFDAGLAVALFALAIRWRQPLGVVVAAAVTADAVVTVAEACTWNLPRVRSAEGSVALVLACLAPVLGATVLWGSVVRMSVAKRSRIATSMRNRASGDP